MKSTVRSTGLRSAVAGLLDHLAHVRNARTDGGELLVERTGLAATSRATVVLPVPGGPKKIIEPTVPVSRATRKDAPSPSRCGCPTTSSRQPWTHAGGQRPSSENRLRDLQ